MVGQFTIGHVRAVTPDGVLEDQLVSVAGGFIDAVQHHPPRVRSDFDGTGLYCVPGFVDIHNDALAKEYRPRPGACVPVEFAAQSVEGNLLASGITTAFHAVSFQAKSAVGMPIRSPKAAEVYGAVNSLEAPRMDHRILHRLDVRCPEGVDLLKAQLGLELAGREPAGVGQGIPPLISHEDHTPGQGQYRDRSVMERWLQEAEAMTTREARQHVDGLIAERGRNRHFKEQTLTWLGGLAHRGAITLMGHDPASPAEIDELLARGGAVAEFPITVDAAQRAASMGLAVVAGAPNILLGGSHSGNVSAAELARNRTLSVLASDYLPSSLLAAALELVRLGLATLPESIGMITANPARAAGLDDRGILAPGKRADLVLFSDAGRWPLIVKTLSASV